MQLLGRTAAGMGGGDDCTEHGSRIVAALEWGELEGRSLSADHEASTAVPRSGRLRPQHKANAEVLDDLEHLGRHVLPLAGRNAALYL